MPVSGLCQRRSEGLRPRLAVHVRSGTRLPRHVEGVWPRGEVQDVVPSLIGVDLNGFRGAIQDEYAGVATNPDGVSFACPETRSVWTGSEWGSVSWILVVRAGIDSLIASEMVGPTGHRHASSGEGQAVNRSVERLNRRYLVEGRARGRGSGCRIRGLRDDLAGHKPRLPTTSGPKFPRAKDWCPRVGLRSVPITR